MKPFFLSISLILSLVFLSCTRNEEIQRFVRADRKKDGLLGSVKSVEWITEDWMGSNTGEPRWSEPTHWRTFEYDRRGRRVREQYEASLINHFDGDGRKLYMEYSDGKTFHFDYDKNGHRIRERYLDADGKLITQWNYRWIPSLMADYLEVCNPDGSVKGRAYWYFDEKGNDVCRRGIDSSHGDYLFESIYEYDESDNVVCYEQFRIDEKGEMSRYVQRFRRNEEPISAWMPHLGGVTTTDYEYEYDDQGNWIFQREYNQAKWIDPDSKTEMRRVHRKIEYYE